MNFRELQERCKNRNFDQIIVVTKDIFKTLANMQKIEHVTPGYIGMQTDKTHPGLKVDGQTVNYCQRVAVVFYQNTSLCFVEPVEGRTLYKQYLEKFGEGICCVRERIPAPRWEGVLKHFKEKGRSLAQTCYSDTCSAAWLDLTEDLGILFEVINDASTEEKPDHAVPARICQINITTPDVKKTIAAVTELLEIGPWEVGCQSDSCVTDYGFRVDGELKAADFAFMLAILVCGNIEWEVIAPVKGPLVYNEFLASHGTGFHHILQEYPAQKWEGTLRDYADNGIALNCKGKLGPVEWCYMDTSRELGFFKEMRTDAVMSKLPDGYFQYYYPEARG